MTTTQMEAFLTLCTTLNFTKAATILHTTQPNLSQIIVNIEHEIGAQLFLRNRRIVKLTPAGEVFFSELKNVLKTYKEAVEKTKHTDKGIIGMLDIGFLGTALINILPQLVDNFRSTYPQILLRLYDYTYSSLVEALIEDKVNLAILPDKELESINGIDKKLLFTDDMCLLVNKNHPLAHLDIVDLSLLSDSSFIMMDPLISKRDVELITGICQNNGFTPKKVSDANTLSNLMMMVECNMGVSILAKHMKHFATDNVRFIPIKGYENHFRIVCAWRKDNIQAIKPFLNIVENFYPN